MRNAGVEGRAGGVAQIAFVSGVALVAFRAGIAGVALIALRAGWAGGSRVDELFEAGELAGPFGGNAAVMGAGEGGIERHALLVVGLAGRPKAERRGFGARPAQLRRA